jgi:hypothetical protein
VYAITRSHSTQAGGDSDEAVADNWELLANGESADATATSSSSSSSSSSLSASSSAATETPKKSTLSSSAVAFDASTINAAAVASAQSPSPNLNPKISPDNPYADCKHLFPSPCVCFPLIVPTVV